MRNHRTATTLLVLVAMLAVASVVYAAAGGNGKGNGPKESHSFGISAGLTAPVGPGREEALDLSLSNPHNFDIRVTNLDVAVRAATSKPGCSGTQNFSVSQIPTSRYPVTVPARQTRTLSQLGFSTASSRPRISMRNLATNQDACKGAALTFDLTGSATK